MVIQRQYSTGTFSYIQMEISPSAIYTGYGLFRLALVASSHCPTSFIGYPAMNRRNLLPT